MAGCKKGKCFIGSIAGESIREEDWSTAIETQRTKIEEFCTSRRALPHPGHVYHFKFCTECGRKLQSA